MYQKMMIKLTLFLILFTIPLSLHAQQPDSVTNEELTKYVVMMDSVETLKKQLTELSSKIVNGNSKISAQRYGQLVSAIDNAEKLKEIKATPDEIAYVKKGVAQRNEQTLKFQNGFSSLMNEYVGFHTFNKVRKAIANDPKVKARYDAEMNKRIAAKTKR